MKVNSYPKIGKLHFRYSCYVVLCSFEIHSFLRIITCLYKYVPPPPFQLSMLATPLLHSFIIIIKICVYLRSTLYTWVNRDLLQSMGSIKYLEANTVVRMLSDVTDDVWATDVVAITHFPLSIFDRHALK